MPNPPLLRIPRLPACRTLGCALALLVAVLSAAGCGDGSGSAPADFTGDGPFAVGNATIRLHDAARDRGLTVEVWYPASVPAGTSVGASVLDFYPAGVERERYAELLAASPDPGPSRRTRSARDAAPARTGAPWPLLVFSHCHECTRFSSFSIAERLASHGFVVAAPDHAGNVLFDAGLGLNVATLQLRAADVRFVATALLSLADGAADLPLDLHGAFDATRVGVFGHSFGGVTTGLVLQDDARFRAGAAIAAPFENPLLPGVEMARIDEPVLFVVAREDNSITEIGNQFIRANFSAMRAPSWKVEAADAGHWSFSDLCHLGTLFTPGCGEGVRQTVPGEPFTYLPIDVGREIGASYVTAFFAAELRGDEAGRAFLAVARPPDVVDVAALP
jgi:predicted dienelactone hydrolase